MSLDTSQDFYALRWPKIERCWGILAFCLENGHWNGALLGSVGTALNWAKTMTWKVIHPVVKLLDRVYETGIRVTKKAFLPFQQRLQPGYQAEPPKISNHKLLFSSRLPCFFR